MIVTIGTIIMIQIFNMTVVHLLHEYYMYDIIYVLYGTCTCVLGYIYYMYDVIYVLCDTCTCVLGYIHYMYDVIYVLCGTCTCIMGYMYYLVHVHIMYYYHACIIIMYPIIHVTCLHHM